MKLNKTALKVNMLTFIILGLLSAFLGGGTGIGAIAFVIGVINIFSGLLKLIVGGKDTALTLLLCGGILLLIGFSLCSAYPLNFGRPEVK